MSECWKKRKKPRKNCNQAKRETAVPGAKEISTDVNAEALFYQKWLFLHERKDLKEFFFPLFFFFANLE